MCVYISHAIKPDSTHIPDFFFEKIMGFCTKTELDDCMMIFRNNYDGLCIPYTLIDRIGPILALKVSSHVKGVHEFSNEDIKVLFSKNIGSYWRYSPEEAKEIVSNKNRQYLSHPKIKSKECEWCQSLTFTLHQHHYPVYRCKGGKNVVRICANCHSDFHTLADNDQFQINDDIIELIHKCEDDETILKLKHEEAILRENERIKNAS